MPHQQTHIGSPFKDVDSGTFLKNLVSDLSSRSRYSLLICVSDLTESVSAFMLSSWQWAAMARTAHWLCLSSLHGAETQTRRALPSQRLEGPFSPPNFRHTDRLSYAYINTRYTLIHTSQVTGIVLRTGLSLAPGDSERPVWISEWQNVSAGCTRRYLSRGLQLPRRNPIQTIAWKHAAFQCSRHRVHR